MATQRTTLNFPGHFESSSINANNTYNANNIHQYFGSREARDTLTLKQIEDWLGGPNQHALQLGHHDQRHPGTGQWFLDSSEFQKYVDGDWGTLCCHGIRGSGKTILMSSAIDYLQKNLADRNIYQRKMLLFIYLDSANSEQHQNKHLVASLLTQVLQQQQQISSTVRDFYFLHQRKGTYPGERELITLLYNELSGLSALYVVIDALDEATERTRKALIKTLYGARLSLFLLVTTYDTKTLGVQFDHSYGARVTYMEITAKEVDLRLYIEGQLCETPSIEELLKENVAKQEKITKILIEKARGMFLLAYLHLELLKASRINTLVNLETMAQNLSPALNKVYKDLWDEVLHQDPADVAIAQNVCVWLSFSTRPLHIDVILHSLLLSEDTNTAIEISKDKLIPELFILGFCKGLVRIESATRTVLFAHYTAQAFFPEYFSNLKDVHPHRDIAVVCLRQLKQVSLSKDKNNTISSDSVIHLLTQLPLLNYAVHSFDHHAQRTPSRDLHPHIMGLFGDQDRADIVALLCAWVCRYTQLSRSPYIRVREITVLHLLAFWGLEDLFSLVMIQGDMSIDEYDKFQWTPLRWALWSGNVKMTRFLVENGADLGHTDTNDHNVMRWALGQAHEPDRWFGTMSADGEGKIDAGRSIFLSPISSTLWTRGPPLNTSEECLLTLIEIASEDFLYEYGTDIFLVAARKRASSVALKLLERGKEGFLSHEATDRGLVEALRGPSYCESYPSLLARDTAKINIGWTVFIDATEWSEIDVGVHMNPDDNRWICALITPENANLRNERDQTVLSLAAEMKMPEVVQTLIDNGADVNAQDGDGRTPLHSAVMRNRSQKIFVHSCTARDQAQVHLGASVYIYGSFDVPSTSLVDAQERLNAEVVKIVLKNGANKHKTFRGRTAFHLAEQEAYYQVRDLVSRSRWRVSEDEFLPAKSLPSHPGVMVGNCEVNDKASVFVGGIYKGYDSHANLAKAGDRYRHYIASGALRAILSLIWIEVDDLILEGEAKASVSAIFRQLPALDKMSTKMFERHDVFDEDLEGLEEATAATNLGNGINEDSGDEFHDAHEDIDSE